MLILMLLLFVAALPLLTGIYYTTIGYVKKRRQTLITGIVLIAAWLVVMYFFSGTIYTVYHTTE